MNAITKALSDIKYRIPRKVLENTFINTRGFEFTNNRLAVSLDHRIRQEVIDGRVLPDINLVGGQEIAVKLDVVAPERLPDFKTVWRIPLSQTNNQTITRVYSIVQGRGTNSLAGSINNTDNGNVISKAAQGMLATLQPISGLSEHDIKLVGENTILITKDFPVHNNMYLRCVVENDPELNNLPPTAIPKFSKLVELAVKSYVYNTLIINMDKAVLEGGRELGVLSSVVENYSDAEEMYQEFLEEQWRKIAFMSDPETHKRHLKRVTGGLH